MSSLALSSIASCSLRGARCLALLGLLELDLRGQLVSLALKRRARLLDGQQLLRFERALLHGKPLFEFHDARVFGGGCIGERALTLDLGQPFLRLALALLGNEARLQLGDARLLLGCVVVRLAQRLGHGQLHGLPLVGGQQLFMATYFLVELGITHLLEDGREAGLVDGERLAASGALDLVHARSFSCFDDSTACAYAWRSHVWNRRRCFRRNPVEAVGRALSICPASCAARRT